VSGKQAFKETSPFSLFVEATAWEPIFKCLAVIFPYTLGHAEAAENFPDILFFSVIAVYAHNE
jgi:hypothetical protein